MQRERLEKIDEEDQNSLLVHQISEQVLFLLFFFRYVCFREVCEKNNWVGKKGDSYEVDDV